MMCRSSQMIGKSRNLPQSNTLAFYKGSFLRNAFNFGNEVSIAIRSRLSRL